MKMKSEELSIIEDAITALAIWLTVLIVGSSLLLNYRLNKIEDQITRIEKLNHIDSLEKLDHIKSLIENK